MRTFEADLNLKNDSPILVEIEYDIIGGYSAATWESPPEEPEMELLGFIVVDDCEDYKAGDSLNKDDFVEDVEKLAWEHAKGGQE